MSEERPRIQPSISRPIARPMSDTEFAQRVADGDYNTVRPSLMLVGSPARPYAGDNMIGDHQLLTHTSYVMALGLQTQTFKAGISTRIGKTGNFDLFAPVGSNPSYPAVPAPWWEFGTGVQRGSFRLTSAATPAYMEIQIQGSVSVTVAQVKYRFLLHNEDGAGNKGGLISASAVDEVKNVDSPNHYDQMMRLQNDGAMPPTPPVYGERISFTPGQWVGLYLERTDAGADRNLTWSHLEVTPKSTHWLG